MTKSCYTLQFFILFTLLSLGTLEKTWSKPNQNQQDSTTRILRLSPHFGLVVPHHADMVYFIKDYSYGLDLNYGITKYNQEWYQYLNYPEVGFGLFYNTFGNARVYGSGLSGYGYIQNNIYRTPRFALRSKVALGMGYVTRPFDLEKNPYNQVFGSTLNVFINFGLMARIPISTHWELSADLAINHLSNGSIKKPNHGINTVTAALGVAYAINGNEMSQYSANIKAPRSNARDLLVFATVGRSQRSLYKPNYYPAMSININHLWWISKKTGWGLGLDGIYYGAAPYEYAEEDQEATLETFTNADKMFGAVFGSYNYRFDNTQIFVHIGAYLLYKTQPLQHIYPRMGVRHRVYKDLYANFSIKASFFKAEFIEFGLGYRINYKKNSL